jgi:hypothetical protein
MKTNDGIPGSIAWVHGKHQVGVPILVVCIAAGIHSCWHPWLS